MGLPQHSGNALLGNIGAYVENVRHNSRQTAVYHFLPRMILPDGSRLDIFADGDDLYEDTNTLKAGSKENPRRRTIADRLSDTYKR